MEPVEVVVSGTIKHESANPAKIEVTRGQKGNYGWTISLSGTNATQIREDIKAIDALLRLDFPQLEGG